MNFKIVLNRELEKAEKLFQVRSLRMDAKYHGLILLLD